MELSVWLAINKHLSPAEGFFSLLAALLYPFFSYVLCLLAHDWSVAVKFSGHRSTAGWFRVVVYPRWMA